MYAKTSTITLSNVSINGIVSNVDGTLGCYGSLIEADNIRMTNNQAHSGRAIHGVLCAAYVTNSLFSNCQASHDGGAIKLSMESELAVSNSTFQSNFATANKGNGGSIYSVGALKMILKASTFVKNYAGRGGAIAVYSTNLDMYDNVFESNEAGHGGGGAILESA